MPTDFRCPECDLRFSVGRYHYHNFVSGYGGRALLACMSCGTQHAIELALPSFGPEFYVIHRLIVESLPKSAIQQVLRWLRREQSKPLRLDEALAVVRHPPFTLVAATREERALEIRGELEPLGVVVRSEFVERQANPSFGPVQLDRVLFHSSPLRGDQQSEWLVGDESVAGIESLHCKHCGRTGTIREEFAAGSPCPACEVGSLKAEAFWIT